MDENEITELGSSPDWQREGWVPVARFEWAAGRTAPRIKDSLIAAIVWSAKDASELKVLWQQRQSFDWSGLVMMRPDPRSPHRIEFATFRLNGDTVQVQKLITVRNDPLTTVDTLLSRLRG